MRHVCTLCVPKKAVLYVYTVTHQTHLKQICFQLVGRGELPLPALHLSSSKQLSLLSSVAGLAGLVKAGAPGSGCWAPVPAGVLQWRGLMWGCSSCLLHPPLPALISALQFTLDQQRLHFTQEFSIFYFLSPSAAHPHHTPAPRPTARQVVPYNLVAGDSDTHTSR